MYQALYRKWRPRTFDEISGQDHITRILRMQCGENRVSHAYLFCGTRGTGKTSTAKILAKAVNCENPVNGNPCNCCFACTSIDSGNATDVLEIDAASNNGVDDIRDLRDEVVYPPSLLKKRVYIIDEVHMLSTGAFNALLKTLEEPPEYIVFILATTELNKLPATIISRCIRFDFSRLSEEVIASRVAYVAEQERIRLGEGAAELLARLADGAMRDALSLLEACTSGLGSENEITVRSVEERVGIAGSDALVSLFSDIASGDLPAALSVLGEVHRSSKDIGVFLEDLSALSRDLLVRRQLGENADKYAGSFRFGKEADALLKRFPDFFTAEMLFYFCSVLDETQGRISRYGTDRKILLEFAIIRLCDPKLSESSESLAARIASLERQIAVGAVRAPRPDTSLPVPEKQEAAPERSPAQQTAPAPKTSAARPFDKLDELTEEMAGHPDLLPFVQSLRAFVSGDELIFRADPFTLTILQTEDNLATLAEAVKLVTGKEYRLVFTENQIEEQNAPVDEL
ncbi:MAG: DNA polymerase III subunit gamma/tau [Clostridiales bacterium]|nr:DNA polymerase III subunit gamma/tau [Candidatus Coliplasma caballi]